MKHDTLAWRDGHEDLVDMTDLDQMLDFVYDYLRNLRRPPTDDAVRQITAVLARCNAGLISYVILKSVVDDALGMRRRSSISE